MGESKFAFDRGGSPVELTAGETSIGSGPDCAIRVEDPKVEPLQATVVIDAEGATLFSRGATEDVRVNGMPSRVAELKTGDTIRFGEAELTLTATGEGTSLAGSAGTFELASGENGVGRSPDGKVVLSDGSVSREHALIVILPGLRVLVRDLLSSNGTFVNGRKLGEVPLKTGDTVEVGGEKMTFVETVLPGAPAAPAASAPSGPQEFRLLVGTELTPLSPGTVRIGRAPDNDITLDDNEVSGKHAELTVAAQEVRIRDLGSSNGTTVNGAPLTSESALQDGDTVRIGRTEILFMAPSSGGGMDKTVLSGSMPDLGKTVVSGGSPAAGAPPPPPPAAPAGVGVLDLPPGASQEQIQRKYQELFSDYQIRLTNAPTPDLKNKYQQKLDELQAARDALITPQSGPAGMDLPSAEPVIGGPEGEAPPPATPPVEVAAIPAEPEAAAPVEEGGKRKARRKRAKKEKKPKPAKSAAASAGDEKGLPKSAVIMAGISAFAVVLTIVLAIFARKSIAVSEGVLEELAAKEASIVAMTERIPEADAEIAALEQGRVALLENSEFKICNLSSRTIYVVWVHSTYVDEDGRFLSFDSAFNDYQQWQVPAGGTTKFGLVKDDRVVWDGSTVFFSVLMQYRGQEIFRSGAWSGIGSDCYNLALDG